MRVLECVDLDLGNYEPDPETMIRAIEAQARRDALLALRETVERLVILEADPRVRAALHEVLAAIDRQLGEGS
jgi:hypothetical protein